MAHDFQLPERPDVRMYRNDAVYHQLVDCMRSFLKEARYQPNDIRKAADLACELHAADQMADAYNFH